MIISTFSVCLHLAAGEVSSGDEVTADILQMASEPLPAAVWSAVVLQVCVVILKIKKRK